MQTERKAYWEEDAGEGKKPLCSQCLFIMSILNLPWLQKFKTLEKNEKIGSMLHCYKTEFNFLQKKFSKHLLHNLIVYAYIVK